MNSIGTAIDASVWLSASELAERIRSGEISATEVTEAHIARLEEVNPSLNAVVIPLFDEARAQAAAADEALTRGAEVGPLHGVPVTIKEQFRVAGTQTTLGASARVGNVNDDEGPLVTALRRAGATVLGKTNVIQTLAGWECDNPVYGRTNNPWDLERSPGGSSGGEAAIVAAGGSALGLGGDFGGSIRVPAHFCGVHGFKPTSGRLSNDDFAPGLLGGGQEAFIAQPGPIGRSVADLQLAMTVLAATSLQPTYDVVAPVPWVDPTPPSRPLRVGIYTDNGYFPVAASVRRVVEEAADALRELGAVVEPVAPPDAHEGVRIFLGAASAGGSTDIFDLLGGEKPIAQISGMLQSVRLPTPVRSIVARVMDARGQHQVARVLRDVGRRSTERYFEIVEARNAYRTAFRDNLDQNGLDAVICPPVALPAFTHGASADLFASVSYALVYNVLGAPAGVVSLSKVRDDEQRPRPDSRDRADSIAGQVETGSAGLPLGVQVVARHWDDQVVLMIMAMLENQFRQTADYPTLSSRPW